MTIKQITFKMEELQQKSWELNGLTLAIHDAIVGEANHVNNFDGALFALTRMTYELESEMKELSDALFDLIRAEKKGVV